MADPPKKPAGGGGMSLYAHLLEPKPASATISSAPVMYDTTKTEEAPNASTKKKDASLMFQPIKRPQVPPKGKPKQPPAMHRASSSSLTGLDASSSPDKQPQGATGSIQPAVQTSTYADWLGDEEEGSYYQDQQKRQRAEQRAEWKKKKKSKKEPKQEARGYDWDDIYDPTRPTRYADYKNSEEQLREIREWKDYLYRMRQRNAKSARPDREEVKPFLTAERNAAFAPPASYNEPARVAPMTDAEKEAKRAEVRARFLAIKAEHDARKANAALAASQQEAPPPPPPPPPPPSEPTVPPPPFTSGATISAAPVRFNVNTNPATNDVDMIDVDNQPPEDYRPKRKAFSALDQLKKFGWKEGEGLGAKKDGIVTALSVKATKRKRKPDAKGGGWAQPANMGNIVGGKRRKVETTDDDDGAYGVLSHVVRLQDMLTGLDIEHEITQNNIMQEIGEDMQRYGSIDRIFIWQQSMGGNNDVFIKFSSQLGALRAVNDKHGLTFADNTVKAAFFPLEKFEAGEYA